MENKIDFKEGNNDITITISPNYNQQKQNLLVVWLVLFSLCGAAIISQFFFDYPTSTKIFFIVYLVFWLFFEFKVIYAIRWRKFGNEIITINSEGIFLTKNIAKRGITEKYELQNISSINVLKHKDKPVYNISSSYWNTNHYTLFLEVNERQIPFGVDLSEKQAKKVLNTVKEHVKKHVENKA